MAVAFVSAVSAQTTANAVSATVAAPAAVGQYAVAALSHGVTAVTWATPAGWTALGASVSTSSQTFALYGKVLTSGDIGTASTFARSDSTLGGKQALAIAVYSGVSSSSPLGAVVIESSNTASASRTSPALSATGRAITVMSSKGTDPGPWTPPAAYTVRASVNQTGTGSVTIAVGDSATDLNGADAWTLALSTSQYQGATLWLNATGANGPTAVAALGQAATGPTFRAGAAAQANALTVPVAVPALAQVGDVALAWHTVGLAGVTQTAPAGWTQVGPTEVTTSQSTALYRKTLASGDLNTSPTFTSSLAGKQSVALAVYYRVDASNPIGAVFTNTFGSSAATTITSPTLVANYRLIEAAIGKGTDPGAWSPPAAFTTRATVTQVGSGATTISVADSTIDLDGEDAWTLAGTAAQSTIWGLWLTPLVANASAIEPYSTVRLIGSGSTAAPGTTISSYSWAWVSGGTAPTLTTVNTSDALFTAPAALTDVTQVYRLTVTDSNNVTSTSDVSATILYATERCVVGGVVVPAQLQVIV